MNLAEMVEPAAPQLRTKERSLGTMAGTGGKLCFGLVIRAEIDACRHSRQDAACHDRGTIGSIKDSVEAGRAQGFLARLHIRLVRPVRAVFIFDLSQDDRAAVR